MKITSMKRTGWVEVLHVSALAFWLGAVVMSGVTAAVVFPTMRELKPSLPGFAAYPGEHWPIAGGRVAVRVFDATDVIKVVGAAIATITLVLQSWPGVPTRVRMVSMVALLAVLGYNLLVLRPRMAQSVGAFWRNAEAGNVEGASVAKAAFDADHPVATRTMAAMAVLLVLNIGVAACSRSRPERTDA